MHSGKKNRKIKTEELEYFSKSNQMWEESLIWCFPNTNDEFSNAVFRQRGGKASMSFWQCVNLYLTCILALLVGNKPQGADRVTFYFWHSNECLLLRKLAINMPILTWSAQQMSSI